jgi:Xaa-Pro aminopeptidase
VIAERAKRLRADLVSRKLDAYVLTHTSDIRWLSGFAGVFDSEAAHLALIAGEESPIIFTDSRYSEALRRSDTQGDWRVLDERRPRLPYLAEVLGEIFSSSSREEPLRIGIEGDLRLDFYRALLKALDESDGPNFELIELNNLVLSLRAIKDAHEVKLLKAAQELTDATWTHMLDWLRVGISERETVCELEFFMRRAGAEAPAFPTIVATGPNSALPHAVAGKRTIQRGDFVLVDFGACLDDYRSDMTRTVMMGEPSERQRAMYEAVQAAQAAVMTMLRPGVSASKAQALADSVLAEHGFEGRLIHSLGHGVGIDIHELPYLASTSDAILEAGQVLTIEPGVYLEGVGGVRIEDYGLVTSSGFEAFTRSAHELVVLPAL